MDEGSRNNWRNSYLNNDILSEKDRTVHENITILG